MSDDLHYVIRSLEARIAELEAERRPRRIGIRRVSRRLAIGLLALAVLVPGVALASHQFSDVPDSNTFHDHIDWLADYGITTGCGGGNFCPSAPVTRGQMAAFMRRLSGEFEVVHQSVNPGSSSFFFLTVDCPDGKRAIAGGGATSENDLMMTDSQPVSFGSGWNVRWETDNNATQDPFSLQVWALCAPRL